MLNKMIIMIIWLFRTMRYSSFFVYSLSQDILREKQNHIEQLLIERDLERQDAENVTLMYQKDLGKVIIYFILVNL